jgi:hypothetical protein
MAKKKKSRLAEEALRDHVWQRQAPLRRHRELMSQIRDGAPDRQCDDTGLLSNLSSQEIRKWFEDQLRHLEEMEAIAAQDVPPAWAEHSSGSFLEWAQIKAAEQAAMDAAVAGAVRKGGGRSKPDRDRRMWREFRQLRQSSPSSVSNTAIMKCLGLKYKLKRRAVLDAVNRGRRQKS